MSAHSKDLSPAQIDALTGFLGGARSPTAASGSRCAASDNTFAGAFSRPHWNGWGAGVAQRRFQSAAMAQLSAADVPRLKLKWAFGFPNATARLCATRGGRWACVRRQRRRQGLCARCQLRMHALGVRGARPGPHRHQRRPGTARLDGLFRRPARQRLWRRCADGPAGVDDAGRRSQGGHHHRRAGSARWCALRACKLHRGGHQHGCVVSVLHLPRQRRGAGRRDRQAALERTQYRRRARTDANERAPGPALGAVRRRGVVVADDRSSQANGLRDDGQQLLRSALGRRKRLRGVSPRVGYPSLGTPDDGWRCVHDGVQQPASGRWQLSQGRRPGLRLRLLGHARAVGGRPPRLDRGPEVGRRTCARP